MRYKPLSLIGSLFLLLSLVSLLGCAPTIQEIKLETPLQEHPNINEISNMDGKAVRTVIRLRGSENSPNISDAHSKNNILKNLAQATDSELGNYPITIVNKDLNNMVRPQDIEIAEMYGKEIGREDIDTILLLAIDEYTSTSNATEKSSLFDSKKKYWKCEYKTGFTGWIRTYRFPSMSKIEQWNIKESNSDSFKGDSKNDCKRQTQELINETNKKQIKYAACSIKHEIAQTLSPIGHILSTKKQGESTLIEISLGSRLGIEPNDTLELFQDITGRKIGNLLVTKDVFTERSFAKVTKLDNEIRIGDIVRPRLSQVNKLNPVLCLFK